MDADPVECLCAILAAETRVCGALAGVLRAERDTVTRLRAEGILACLEQR